MRLREAQELFFGLVVAPEGVAKALEEREARGETTRALFDELFAGDARMGAVERLDVYANMYFFRLRDVLAEDFARTSAALGEARWHNLVTDYLLAHPPTRWSLRWAGEALPEFLRTHARGAERPWLADVAALERARNEAFQAEDAAPLRAEELLNVHPAVWATLTFGATPGTAVISSRWDLAAWWESGGEGAPAEVPEGQALLVWRDAEDDVQQEALRSEDAEAARRLLAGAPFAEVCEAFAPEDAGEAEAEEAGRRALELLLRLVARRGLVCTLHSARSRRV
ncbi:MAG: DNA-binding domain-containing protein [Thermoanaerobaculia bacterium]